MGTRADFYVGAGETAEWLGSIAFDGYRIHEMVQSDAGRSDDNQACWDIKSATSEAVFREAVSRLLSLNSDATTPDQGWPWPWNSSVTTDYAYRFEDDRTASYNWGAPATEDGEEDTPKVSWPDMQSRKNVTFGERSGALFFEAR